MGWPREAAATERTETSSSDSRSEADPSRGWHEGLFLEMLLDRMAGCLDMDYDANLGLTSVVARLAQLPHPHLHEFLLNPTVPLVPGARTLFTVLKEVVGSAVQRSEAVLVIDECCKELAAVTFVKYHHFSST